MNSPHSANPAGTASRTGFTLVEMLVATGLVVLIMSLFAQIYGTAVSSMSEQRGMGNNDQKARVLSEILRSDLKNMTYRQSAVNGVAAGLIPILPGDEALAGVIDGDNQSGYFYVSENDPNLPTDDILQFTTKVRLNSPTSADRYYGDTVNLSVGNDEPFHDQGSLYAEVSYFLRQGTLYRRALLIREPTLPFDPTPTAEFGQPRSNTGDTRFNTGAQDYAGNPFWYDFDYSATRFYPANPAENYLWFNSTLSLDNTGGAVANPIAQPWNRYGHLNLPSAPLHHGRPKEYANTDPRSFMGRMTLRESADASMVYPATQNGSRFNRSASLNLNDGGVLDDLTTPNSTARFGDDVVMTNVESFDVEVWDDKEKSFVQLGHASTLGENQTQFAAANNKNQDYGPTQNASNVFDTWHYAANQIGSGRPPYRPVADNTAESGYLATRNDSTAYNLGDKLLLSQLQTFGFNNSVYFEVIQAGTSGAGDPGLHYDATGAPQPDGGVYWKCVDNRIGLRGVRVTIRYFDLQSQLPRQLSIVHSFTH